MYACINTILLSMSLLFTSSLPHPTIALYYLLSLVKWDPETDISTLDLQFVSSSQFLRGKDYKHPKATQVNSAPEDGFKFYVQGE